MLNRLAIFGLLCFGLVSGSWSQVPRDGSKQQEKSQEQQDNAKSLKPTPVANHTQDETSDQKQGSEQKSTKYPWDELLAPANIPNWVLVIVAALTGGVICWQSIETRKAAESAEKQTTLQSAALRQWVNVVPLGIDIPRALKNPCEVMVQFEVQNKTDYLVTIKGVEFELIPNIHSIGKFKVDCDFALVPRKSEDDSAFPFAGKCVVDLGELDGWGKIFIVAGDIKFLDCMEREQVQHFQDLYRGFIDGRLERMKPSSIESTEDEPEDQIQIRTQLKQQRTCAKTAS